MKINVNSVSGMVDTEPCEAMAGVPCGYVIFGASGDLTLRKLIPAVFSLFRTQKIPEHFFVVGFARSIMTDNEFRLKVMDSIRHANGDIPKSEIEDFAMRCFYVAGGYDQDDGYITLHEKTAELGKRFGTGGNLVFHIATPPALYAAIVSFLGRNGLVTRHQNEKPFHRVIVEKPFGHDLESGVNLNKELLEHLADEQIYRIDHYLGKETVQNILMFRFANQIFEPAWNRHYIDHVQITVAEQLGVEHRAGYFEQTGLLRDMFQNHMLQLAALVGMEPPVDASAESVRDEKVKFMKSIRPFDLENLETQLIKGQYVEGEVSGKKLMAYREEKGVAATSCTETYFAMKLFVDNWRWKDVPFYLQAGKRLEQKLTRIAVIFKKVPHSMFTRNLKELDPSPNILVFEIQPRQGTSLLFQAKVPGAKMCLAPLTMELDYRDVFGTKMDEDYSTLILDCMLGDQTLYWRRDGVETSWKLLDPVLQKWQAECREAKDSALQRYAAGGWGPAAGKRLLEEDGRAWIVP
jgi:glucose-6-phosphate 1-dehydrogenase